MNLIQMLRCAVEGHPERGITYLDAAGGAERQTYPALHASALRLWSHLRTLGVSKGDAVISQLPESQAQITLFWACVLGGAVPVLLPTVMGWARESEHKKKLLSVWELLGKPVIVIDDKQASLYDRMAADGTLPGVRHVNIDRVPATEEAASAIPWPEAAGHELAFLQFSSGSTGSPKGVRLSHRNLWTNVTDIAAAAQMSERDVFLSWMPYFHDMGIIGMHLVPMALGCDQVKMEASSFALNPRRWLEALHRYQATIASSPNFGLELVLDKVSEQEVHGLDLSSVRLLFNGAEPIQARTMRDFMARLQPANLAATAMYPVYGMAEASLAVTFGTPGDLPVTHALSTAVLADDGVAKPAATGMQALEYVDVGRPLPSMGLRICDAGDRPCPERHVGEIQIRGDNVTNGYLGDPDVNEHAFTSDGWLRTGDLGFVAAGRLTVVGRSKEIIILNGRKIMASDVEEAASRLFDLANSSLCACPTSLGGGQKEGLVLFVAVRRRPDRLAWLSRIQDELAQYLGFAIDSVVAVTAIPKTSSGKKQRVRLAQRLRDGEFEQDVAELAAWRATCATDAAAPQDDTTRRVREAWSRVLGIPEASIGLDRPFLGLGGDSVKAVRLLSDLESAFQHKFGFDLLLECHTIGETVRYIGDRDLRGPRSEAPAEQAPRPAGADDAGHSGKVAIVGHALRFPGACDGDAFWELVSRGDSAVQAVPEARWPGQGRARQMGLLEGIDLFDAAFFGIDEDEARWIDPQQRLALMVAYEALERAGYAGTRLDARRQVGVFVGASANGYVDRITASLQSGGPGRTVPPNLMAGNLINMIAARIAHQLDFKGQALTIDSACSSSLVAIQLACEQLLNGQCDMALAGGANVIVTATVHQWFEFAGALSADGVSRPFDAKANGMVPGEGVGMLVLKRLDKALQDGDRIEAVIEASAVNNDGKSIGIMAPNPDGQEALLRQVYAPGKMSPAQVDYIETHGTGTPLGDPIEFRSLCRVFTGSADQPPSCALGSVKPNVGHLLAAAGVAGVIKVLQAFRHAQIPPMANFQKPNPMVHLQGSRFYIPTTLQAWPRAEHARTAAISSFGFGGTNAHLVLSDAPPQAAQAPHARGGRCELLCLSARSDAQLRQVAGRLAGYLRHHPQADLASLCHSQNTGRQQFRTRRYVVMDTTRELLEGLDALGTAVMADDTPAAPPMRKVALVLGNDLADEALRLDEHADTALPAFGKRLEEVLRLAQPRMPAGCDLGKRMRSRAVPAGEQASITAAVNFIVEYALARALMDAGLKPALLIGCGAGRVVAACLAQFCSVEAALDIVLAQAGWAAAMPARANGAVPSNGVDAADVQAPRIPICWTDAPGLTPADASKPSHWTCPPAGDFVRPAQLAEVLASARIDGLVFTGGLGNRSDRLAGPDPEIARIAARGLPHAAGLGERAVKDMLGQLWERGIPVDLGMLSSGGQGMLALPTYPFDVRSHWID